MKYNLRFLNESQFNHLINEAATIEKAYTGYENIISPEDFQKLIQADPTYKANKPNYAGKLFKWIINAYQQDNSILNNLAKVREDMAFFVQNHNMVGSKKITDFPTYNDLHQFVNQLKGVTEDETLSAISNPQVREGTNVLYNSSDWMIINPTNYEASRHWGGDTSWCTAAGENGTYDGRRMFENYSKQGPLLINIDKNSGSKFQFHFESDSFMDESDEPIHKPIADTIYMPSEVLDFYQEKFGDKAVDQLTDRGYEVQHEFDTGLQIVCQASHNDNGDRSYNLKWNNSENPILEEDVDYIDYVGNIIIVQDYWDRGVYLANGEQIDTMLDNVEWTCKFTNTAEGDNGESYPYFVAEYSGVDVILAFDNDGVLQVQEEFDEIDTIRNESNYLKVTRNEGKGVFDIINDTILANTFFSNVEIYNAQDYFIATNEEDKKTVVSFDGEIMGNGNAWFDLVSAPVNNICQAQTGDEMTWVYFDSGKPLFPNISYPMVDYFINGYARIKTEQGTYTLASQEDGLPIYNGSVIFKGCPGRVQNNCVIDMNGYNYILYNVPLNKLVIPEDKDINLHYDFNNKIYKINKPYDPRYEGEVVLYDGEQDKFYLQDKNNEISQQQAYQILKINQTANEAQIRRMVNMITESVIRQLRIK